MSKWERASRILIRHLNISLRSLSQNDISKFCDFLLETKRRDGALYLIGAGRSLDVLKLFGARIMQDPINLVTQPLALLPKPHIGDVDSALICTGTGETAPVISITESWMKINKNIGLITSLASKKHNSRILELVTRPKSLIFLPGITKRDIERRRKRPHEIHSPLTEIFFKKTILIPSQTKFELAVLAFLESVITELYFICEENVNGDTMP